MERKQLECAGLRDERPCACAGGVSGVLMFTNTPMPGTNNFWRVRSVP
jgi:hypothetical protein